MLSLREYIHCCTNKYFFFFFLFFADAKRLIGRRFEDPVVQSDMKHWPFNVISDSGRPKVEVEYKGETKTFYPEEISSMVLTKMKEIAEAYLGKVSLQTNNQLSNYLQFCPSVLKSPLHFFSLCRTLLSQCPHTLMTLNVKQPRMLELSRV